MAKKRMFDNSLIDTDRFRRLGQSAKALYFCLGMDADDDGFVSFEKISALHGFKIDDLKVLCASEWVIAFPSGMVVITHFRRNNYIDKRWYKPTLFQNEFRQLNEANNGFYTLRELSENSQLDKIRLDKIRLESNAGEPVKGEVNDEEQKEREKVLELLKKTESEIQIQKQKKEDENELRYEPIINK